MLLQDTFKCLPYISSELKAVHDASVSAAPALLSQWEDCDLDLQMILFFLIEQLIVYSVPAINVNEKPLSLQPYP